MDSKRLLEALVQTKRIYNLLGELLDLSRQLAEAMDRDDQVSIRMVMAMRWEPLHAWAQARDALEQQMESAPEEDARRLKRLLEGAPARKDEERPLADQVAANARLLQQVRELDERLNRKLTGDKTFYAET